MKRRPALRYERMPSQGARREEILQTAAKLFASSGFRTTLSDIADHCGILPGSLYHHFDSKEAIIVELVNRYHEDLDRVAKEATDTLHEPLPRSAEDRIVEFGEAIAACGVRHRAALLLTLYEPPLVAGEELSGIDMQTPEAIRTAMLELLRAGRSSGTIRPGLDLPLLADRLCQSMLHVGVGVSHVTPGGEEVPDMRNSAPAPRARRATALEERARSLRRTPSCQAGDRSLGQSTRPGRRPPPSPPIGGTC